MAAILSFQRPRTVVLPPLTAWTNRPQTKRYHALMDAALLAGIHFTPTQFADALFSLYVQIGIVPSPTRDEPPASVTRGIASELINGADEAGDTRARAALRKALTDFNRGTRPIFVPGGWLVPSATKHDRLYRVDTTHRCTCEAGQYFTMCRHVALVEIITVAYERWHTMIDHLANERFRS